MRKFISLCVLWVTLGWLSGCSPEYNWRESSVAEERAVVMFPARAKTEQRQIEVEGVSLTFSLTSAAVRESVFSVGYAKLDDNVSAIKAQALVDAFVQALARRAGQAAPAQAASGGIFTLESQVNGKPSRLMGRVLVHRGMLIQVVVSGPTQSLSLENASDFMQSLVLR
ncbi:hypothetical protein KZZ10_06805 [Alcaligenaceae bacterium LF4-65]|uniref:Lipoprotein n=1 Tax=Zwartia hollandica TaxID=324606 RepID=A0A953N9T7_9BURK|nr:hypothetical protein [Zwartia hollandica]MBZ1350352.1 hypothetical protein [Zwartia hollandica]